MKPIKHNENILVLVKKLKMQLSCQEAEVLHRIQGSDSVLLNLDLEE